eukprot:8312883-Ditylum_brightwellii.AAC.1
MENGKLGEKMREAQWYMEPRQQVESVYIGDQIRSVECASMRMNHWLTVVPCTANNSVMGNDELWDMYVLQCKTGGLIGAHNDDYRDDLGLIATQAFSPSAICDDPIISKG